MGFGLIFARIPKTGYDGAYSDQFFEVSPSKVRYYQQLTQVSQPAADEISMAIKNHNSIAPSARLRRAAGRNGRVAVQDYVLVLLFVSIVG